MVVVVAAAVVVVVVVVVVPLLSCNVSEDVFNRRLKSILFALEALLIVFLKELKPL